MLNTDPLVRLFGGIARVKILRFFLLNQEVVVDKSEISKRSKIPMSVLGKELSMLTSIGFLKQANLAVEGVKGKKVKIRGWKLNSEWKLNSALSELLFDTDLFSGDELIRRFQVIGKLKLIVTAGVFLRESGSRVDLLLVADNLKKNVLDRVLKQLESEIGRELNYSVFSSADFQYRVSMYDKFVRDVLDYPHNTILDKLGLEPRPYSV